MDIRRPLYNTTEEPQMRNGVNRSINRHGLREEPFPTEKPPGTLRILVVGDSFTVGYGLNRSQRYTKKTEHLLDQQFSADIEVLNAGLSGTGMEDYYRYLYDRGMKFDPDIVVVSFLRTDHGSWSDTQQRLQQVVDTYNLSSVRT